MRTVYKYASTLDEVRKLMGLLTFHVPVHSELVSVREQGDSVCLWFAVDPDAVREKREFAVVGTGRAAPEKARPLGSCHFFDGTLILHVFDGAS